MFRIFLSLLFLLSVSGFVFACGGDDDDDSGNPFATPGGDSGDDSDGDDSGDDDSDDDGSDADDDGDSGSGGDVDLDDVADGDYGGGTLHLVISGDADQELDLEDGGGFATSGFATFAFTPEDAILVHMSFGADDEPGGITIVTEEVVTAGVWAEDCDASLEDTGNGVRGEFSCDDLEGYDPEDNDIFDNIDVRGEFSLTRE